MPAFVWKGKTRDGKAVSGERVADNKETVMALLRRDQVLVSSVKEKGREISLPKFGGGVPAKDLAIFTRQFSTMIDAGLPIVQSLDVLFDQTDNKALKDVIRSVRKDVSGGSTLADALGKHPKVFDDLYVNMVKAGEAGGVLNTILNRIAMFIEKANKLKKKVKGAMIYPATIVVVAVGVVTILLLFVIPVFAELYGGMGKALPAPTQITINVSDWFRANFLYLAGGIVLAIIALRMYAKTNQGQIVIDGIMLKLPILGDLLRKVAVARFSQNMSILLASGVPILDGLAITARTAGNKIIEKAIMDARISISEGKTVAEPLAASKVFPPMVCQMVAIGENTGALDTMLKRVGDFYEDEVDNAVANLTALMEPLIMIVLGVILGGLVISMYLPIFQLGSLVA